MAVIKEIKVTFAALTNQKQNLKREQSNIGNMLNTLENEMNRMKAGWEGDAGTEFYNKFRALKPKFQKLGESTGQYGDFLGKAANDYERAEKTNVQTASGLNI